MEMQQCCYKAKHTADRIVTGEQHHFELGNRNINLACIDLSCSSRVFVSVGFDGEAVHSFASLFAVVVSDAVQNVR